jgi:hypothetical protein
VAARTTRITLVPHLARISEPPRSAHRRRGFRAGNLFLRQGALDGACGPYCVFMALTAYGLTSPDELGWSHAPDGRTRLGKLVSALQEYEPLFRGGTDTSDLVALIDQSFKEILSYQVHENEGNARALANAVVADVQQGRLVVLWVDGSHLSHWVLVVGVEEAAGSRRARNALLVLDPSAEPPTISAWNAVVELGKYRHQLLPQNKRVRFLAALSLWAKRKPRARAS